MHFHCVHEYQTWIKSRKSTQATSLYVSFKNSDDLHFTKVLHSLLMLTVIVLSGQGLVLDDYYGLYSTVGL